MPALECKELCKSYGRTMALDRLSLAIEPGRIVGLLGPNGSGKTTLIKLANGLLTPDEGYITICGRAPGPESRRDVSYLPERIAIPTWMSAKQLLDFYGDFYECKGTGYLRRRDKTGGGGESSDTMQIRPGIGYI